MKWDELEKAAKAATPGPWVANEWASTDSDGAIDVCGTSVISPKELCGIFTVALEGNDTNDVDFIAAANPAAILELLSVARELAKALKQAVAWIDGDRTPVNAMAHARAALARYEGEQHDGS